MPRDGRGSSQHDDTKKGKKKMVVLFCEEGKMGQTTSVD
jgi:hypothetical protein